MVQDEGFQGDGDAITTDRAAWKPLGGKCYGHIPHLPGSRVGPGDHMCHEGQARIATERARDKHDEVIVQEKVDGSNVGVARIGGELYALGRSGYLAESSRYKQHQVFAVWVRNNADRFLAVLKDGERLCGEWLMQAHGTRYQLVHEPFVAFDLMVGHVRTTYDEFMARIAAGGFTPPALIHRGSPLSVENAMERLGLHGFHGAVDPAEGVVWRVERDEITERGRSERCRVVSFLVKYVRLDKIDGIYLPELSGLPPVYNWLPNGCALEMDEPLPEIDPATGLPERKHEGPTLHLTSL
jgi:hypothetical protein